MIFYKSLWMCAIFAAIIVLQILSAMLRGRLARILSFVNIGLHIILIPVSLFEGAEFSELALLFALSLAVYSLASYIRARLRARSAAGSDGEEASPPSEQTPASDVGGDAP